MIPKTSTVKYSRLNLVKRREANKYRWRRLAWVRPTNKKTKILNSTLTQQYLFKKKHTPYAKLVGYSHIVLTFSIFGKIRTMPNRLRRFLIARAKKLKHRDVLSKKCWITLGVLFFVFTKGQNMRMGKGDGSLYSSYRYVIPSKPVLIIGSNSLKLQTFFRNYLSSRFGSPVKYFFKPSFKYYTPKTQISIPKFAKKLNMRYRYSRIRSNRKAKFAKSLTRSKNKTYQFKWSSIFRKKIFSKVSPNVMYTCLTKLTHHNLILNSNSLAPLGCLAKQKKFFSNNIDFKVASFFL